MRTGVALIALVSLLALLVLLVVGFRFYACPPRPTARPRISCRFPMGGPNASLGQPAVAGGSWVVTALFDIGRATARGDGRKFSEYLVWFERMLQLKAQMIVFVDPSLQDWVRLRRNGGGVATIIRPHPFEDCPAYRHLARFRTILADPEFRKSVKAPNDL